jgi:hypothetical protein
VIYILSINRTKNLAIFHHYYSQLLLLLLPPCCGSCDFRIFLLQFHSIAAGIDGKMEFLFCCSPGSAAARLALVVLVLALVLGRWCCHCLFNSEENQSKKKKKESSESNRQAAEVIHNFFLGFSLWAGSQSRCLGMALGMASLFSANKGASLDREGICFFEILSSSSQQSMSSSRDSF